MRLFEQSIQPRAFLDDVSSGVLCGDCFPARDDIDQVLGLERTDAFVDEVEGGDFARGEGVGSLHESQPGGLEGIGRRQVQQTFTPPRRSWWREVSMASFWLFFGRLPAVSPSECPAPSTDTSVRPSESTAPSSSRARSGPFRFRPFSFKHLSMLLETMEIC